MDIWKPLIGDDSLRCKREDDNMHGENAVAVIHSNHTGPRVVGYVLFLYSSAFKKLLSLSNHTIRGCWLLERELTDARYGLEIPVQSVFNGNEKAL